MVAALVQAMVTGAATSCSCHKCLRTPLGVWVGVGDVDY